MGEEQVLQAPSRDYSSVLGLALEKAKNALSSKGIVFSVEEGKGFYDIIVEREYLVAGATALKEAGFDHVVSLTVTDYPKEKKFRLVYHLTSYLDYEIAGAIIGLGVEVPRSDRPSVPSLTQVWRSAEFQEREVYEFFGIEFEGHPDLRPLLLTPPVAELRPLRKDFVVREENIYEGVPKSG
ncbi:MAG: NADH-quinone oxidoreductase subunit C [Aeropyrum sp.]|nr:NADH-quinone oxidoreductase subunit C [Aeropyrum sp.]MCE4616823.1 NADH-quinone oxidoreductase subunit C [Aeropyrum sp.]